MSLQDKYRPVIDMGQSIGARNVSVREEDGKLKFSGTVKGPDEKVQLWNKIKEIGGENPTDIEADITMDNPGGEAGGAAKSGKTYTVKSGDTLSKIAKEHYGDANRYNEIFEANRDKLDDPNKIQPGQELVIP
ncbi:MAG: LysM peptidoglycan-binding domain-containing protein [Ignavibacteriae bacterium]|nr:MAG: LysM peptidoglycan-binding domain-containing protein [Ignavibacteriota bacterium]